MVNPDAPSRPVAARPRPAAPVQPKGGVARIYHPRRAMTYQRLSIPTVATVAWTTDQVMRRLFPSESIAEWTHGSGEVSLVERSLPEAWAGHKLGGLHEHGKFQLSVLT